MSRGWQTLGLGLVLGAYLAIGTGYARLTPIWQVPDEPAHYNYVAQLAEAGPWPPVIEPGDYPFERLETLKAERFPPGSSIAGIEYENHQPPAYYYLALPIFRLSGPDPSERVVAIRLLGLLLGSLSVCLTWAAARIVTPNDPLLALGSAGFVAFLPMHLTMSAGVNNDSLAYALTAAAALLGLARISGVVERRRFIRLGGLLIGLAVWTKVTALAPTTAMLLAAELLPPSPPAASSRRQALRGLAGMLLGAGLVASPWLLRNARVYTAGDWLGLRAHAAAVACSRASGCQPRTADWIAEHGLSNLLGRMLDFGFKSFWGVFGWMSVFLDRLAGIPIYPVLALISLLAALGLALHLRGPGAGPRQALHRNQLAMLAIGCAASLANFLGYNLSYVQHQGRYLLPALLPIALLFCLGLRELGLRLAAVSGHAGPGARRLASLGPIAFAIALLGLSWIALHRYIVPGLS